MRRIFYSWQASSPPKLNRFLIRDCLQKAAESLASPADVDEATRNVPGSPEIFETILEKISRSAAVVFDVTLFPIQEHGRSRYTSNPNVLVEYGYALARLGSRRLVFVMNTAFGSVEDLPFDMKSKAVKVVYDLKADSVALDVKRVRPNLTGRLRSQLRLILEDPKAAFSLDDTAVQIARHMLNECADGCHCKYVDQIAIGEALGLREREVSQSVAELVSREYLGRQPILTDVPPVRVEPRLFWDFDPFVQGWDPREDARTIANAVAGSSETGYGQLDTRQFAELQCWSLRRLNPALSYLVDSCLIDASETLAPDLITTLVLENEETRRFLREDWNPDNT